MAVKSFFLTNTLTPEDARLLLALRQGGKLYEIEKWIASGQSLRVRPELKKTPLGEAVTTGPQSRRLFVRNETDESVKNEALAEPFLRHCSRSCGKIKTLGEFYLFR